MIALSADGSRLPAAPFWSGKIHSPSVFSDGRTNVYSSDFLFLQAPRFKVKPGSGSRPIAASSDDLVKHIEPLLLPAVTKGPVPTIAGPEPLTIATRLFAAFQQGKIDRSLLGSDFDAFLTPERLELVSASFRKLGEPKSVKLLSTVERGGMAYSELEFEFEKAGFLGDLYRTPDGKVQEFLLFAK